MAASDAALPMDGWALREVSEDNKDLCLSSAVARKLYNQEEFTTVVKEVENIVNSRPLTYQANDALDQPLTPSQLLWGRNLPIMPQLLQPNTEDDSNTETKELRHQ